MTGKPKKQRFQTDVIAMRAKRRVVRKRGTKAQPRKDLDAWVGDDNCGVPSDFECALASSVRVKGLGES